MRFSNLAERQIQKAKLEGKLDGLEGEGKKLPDRPYEDADAVGMRIMAQAGVVPREFQLKKAVDAQWLVVKSAIDSEDKKREMAKLADLQLRLGIEQDARKKFYSNS